MIAGIIQARVGSERFPRKVLEELNGKPLIMHVVDNTLKSRFIDRLVIATGDKEENKPIIEIANQRGVEAYQGSEWNVLDRFFNVAHKIKADTVVRICADNPLLDSLIIDELIEYYLAGNVDYVNNWKAYPEGMHLEVFSMDALHKAWANAAKPSEKEHVTPFIYNNPELFTTSLFLNKPNALPIKLSVDHPCDFELVRSIYEILEGKEASYDAISQLYKKQPALFAINSHVPHLEGYQKSLEEETQYAME